MGLNQQQVDILLYQALNAEDIFLKDSRMSLNAFSTFVNEYAVQTNPNIFRRIATSVAGWYRDVTDPVKRFTAHMQRGWENFIFDLYREPDRMKQIQSEDSLVRAFLDFVYPEIGAKMKLLPLSVSDIVDEKDIVKYDLPYIDYMLHGEKGELAKKYMKDEKFKELVTWHDRIKNYTTNVEVIHRDRISRIGTEIFGGAVGTEDLINLYYETGGKLFIEQGGEIVIPEELYEKIKDQYGDQVDVITLGRGRKRYYVKEGTELAQKIKENKDNLLRHLEAIHKIDLVEDKDYFAIRYKRAKESYLNKLSEKFGVKPDLNAMELYNLYNFIESGVDTKTGKVKDVKFLRENWKKIFGEDNVDKYFEYRKGEFYLTEEGKEAFENLRKYHKEHSLVKTFKDGYYLVLGSTIENAYDQMGVFLGMRLDHIDADRFVKDKSKLKDVHEAIEILKNTEASAREKSYAIEILTRNLDLKSVAQHDEFLAKVLKSPQEREFFVEYIARYGIVDLEEFTESKSAKLHLKNDVLFNHLEDYAEQRARLEILQKLRDSLDPRTVNALHYNAELLKESMKSAFKDVLMMFAEDGNKGALRVVVYGDRRDRSELNNVFSNNYKSNRLGGG